MYVCVCGSTFVFSLKGAGFVFSDISKLYGNIYRAVGSSNAAAYLELRIAKQNRHSSKCVRFVLQVHVVERVDKGRKSA